MKGAVNLPDFGISVFESLLSEYPVFGIPDFGNPGSGFSVSRRVPVWAFPTFGILALGILFSEIPSSESLFSEFPQSEF